jgi:hypothetical protein
MRDCVCFVYANVNGEPKPVGTAFFLFIPIRGTTGTIVVVTALHVIAKIQENTEDGMVMLRVNTKDGGFRFVVIPAGAWVKPDQSDEIVDVCFFPWHFPWETSDFDIKYFSADQAATADVIATQALGVGNEVAFAGLFVKHHGTQQNEPFFRFGNISAMPREPVSTRYGNIDVEIDAYLIESRSVGGLSGSPVFVDPGLFRIEGDARQWRSGGDPGGYLLGVMHGHWDAPKEAAEVGAGDGEVGVGAADADPFGIAKEYINMGVAVVTPIDKLLKLFDDSPLRRLYDAAGEHVTGEEQSPVVIQIDMSTLELVAMDVDTGQLLPAAPSEPTVPDNAGTE